MYLCIVFNYLGGVPCRGTREIALCCFSSCLVFRFRVVVDAMSGFKYCILLTLLLIGVSFAYPQGSGMETVLDSTARKPAIRYEVHRDSKRFDKQNTDINIHFKFDKYNLELGYMGNAMSFIDFAHKIDSIGIENIDSVVIVSQSSPEGVYEHNVWLSKNRARTMRKYILEHHPNLSDILYVHPDGESWARLREYVKKDTVMSGSMKEKVLSVIDADINIGTKKWRMEQLPVYRYLLRTYYPRIRNSAFCIVYFKEVKSSLSTIVPETPMPVVDIKGVTSDIDMMPYPKLIEPEVWIRQLHLKTNAIAWGFAISNVAAEIDLSKHLSFDLPIYYSAWNYFKSTIKFRTFAVVPELRYWFSEANEGFYAGTHFGMAFYNYAFDGAYRYQDYNRETPAIGGGVGVGYRMPLSKDKRWKLEFVLGAGVYSLHYDKFYNTPNVKDGLRIESIRKTYWGIDQAAISFSYSFDLNKKKGAK